MPYKHTPRAYHIPLFMHHFDIFFSVLTLRPNNTRESTYCFTSFLHMKISKRYANHYLFIGIVLKDVDADVNIVLIVPSVKTVTKSDCQCSPSVMYRTLRRACQREVTKRGNSYTGVREETSSHTCLLYTSRCV